MFTKAGTVARLFLLYLLSTCGLVGSSPDGDLPVYCAKDVAASRRVPPLVFRDELNPVLAQVQVFHRHGARTPASPHPCWAGFEEANWSCSLHEKVHVGMDFSPPSPSDQPTNGEVSTQPPDPSAALTPSPVPKAALVVSKIFDGLGPNPSDFVGDCMVGQLLAEGEDQMREIGRHLRDAYVLEVENPEGEPAFFSANLSESGFNLPLGRFKKPPLHLFSSIEIDLYRQDPAWSQNAVFWRSDDVPRVYASGAAMLAELLSLPPAKPGAPEPPGGLPWERRRTTQSLRGVGGGRGSEEDRKKSERGGRTLHDSLFLPPDGGEVIQIPVHIGHINEDWLRGGDQHCDVEGLRLEALNSSAYREFYSDKENVQLRAALSEVLQTDVGEIPFDFEDCLMTFACTDKRPTLPSGLEVGGPLFQSSVEYIDQMWQIQAKHANHRANSLRMYPLVAEMSDLLHQAQYQYSIDPFQLIGRRREEEEGSPRRSLHQVGRYFPDNSPPLVVFSGHDTTIGPLLDVLGLWDGKWPPYASLLLLEMYFTTEGRKFRLIYNGEVVTHRFKGCKDDQSEHLCDLSVFFETTSWTNGGSLAPSPSTCNDTEAQHALRKEAKRVRKLRRKAAEKEENTRVEGMAGTGVMGSSAPPPLSFHSLGPDGKVPFRLRQREMFFAPLDLEGSLVSIGGTEVERSGGGGATEDMGGTGDDNKETSGGDGEGEEENKEEETETGDGGQNGRDGTPGPATEGHLPSSSSSSHRGAFTSAFLFFVLTAGCGCGCCMGIGALRVFEKQKKMDEERERALESGDALPTVHALPFGTVTAAEAGNGTSMRSQPQVREARDGDKSVVKSIVTKAKKAAGTVARKVGEKTSSLSGRGGVMPSVKGKGRGGGKKKGKTFYIELNEEGDATSSRPSMGLEGGHLPQSRGSREDPFALDTDGLPVPRGHMERGGGESGDHVSSGIGRGVLYVEGGGGEGGYNVQHQGVAEQKRRKKGKFSRKGYGRVGEGRGREEEEEEDGEEGGESGSSDDGRKAQAQALRGRPNSGQSSGGHGMVGMRGGVGEIEDEDGEEEEEEEDIDLDSSGSEEERESPDRSQRGNPNAYAANLL